MPPDQPRATDPDPAPAAAPMPAAPDLPSLDAAAVGSVAGAAEARERRNRAGLRRALDQRLATVVDRMSDAFLTLGPDWRVTYANREAARLNGTTPDALVGRNHWEVWPETLGGAVEREYRRAVAEGVPVQLEHRYEGAGVWHDIRAYPSDDGGLAIFYRDITAQKTLESERERQARELAEAHEVAMAAETQFRLLVDHVRDYAVFLMDPDGVVTHWGLGAERIKRWKAEDIVGQHLRVLYPPEGVAEDGGADEHLRHAAVHGEYIGEGTRLRGDGELFPARVVLTALHRGGRLAGFSKITQDLTGERQRAALVRQAIHAAEAANQAKSQFLANTSHEIRTPLNAIIGYAQLLDLGLAETLGPRQRQYVGRIQSTSRHLLSLVNDVLDLSRIEAGQMLTLREPGLLRDATAAAVSLVEPQVQAQRIVLTDACAVAADTAYRGDVERVRQILVNLLSNAVRFTEPGGRVTISCGTADRAPAEAVTTHEGPWAFVRVEDTGAGIARDQIERMWEAFVQVDASHTRKHGGSGLGLAISRHLARLMGGDITVWSQPGLGSSFVLWLPAAEPGEGGDRASDGDDVALTQEPEASVPEADPQVALREVGSAGSDGLSDIADALLTEVERVVATYAARLRRDPAVPGARDLRETAVEDHSATFLTDVAQCLMVVGQDGPEAEQMLADGSAIQHLIALRHGEQRAELGWDLAQLRRDYEILREEIHAAIHRHVTRGGATDVERALGIVNHFLARAEEASVGVFGKV